MIEGPEVEAHHHRTGHSHLDLILGCLAVVLSMVSVFIAVRHGETMEKLVAANSWPNLSYSTGNQADDGAPVITLNLRNTGVGPARIDSFEVFYKGVPVRNAPALLAACCAKALLNFSMSLVKDEVLPARDMIEFMSVRAAANPPGLYAALDKERLNLRVRACYCSVFDECWVMDTDRRRPERIRECAPTQPVQFGL